MKTMNYNLGYLIVLLMISIVMTGQNNPDFTLASNGVTCLCPDADFGDSGTLTINGEDKTFTKRSRTQLDNIIATDIDDPQIALTCTSGITDMSSLFQNQTLFNQNLEHWDVSNVSNMSDMFSNASTFNQPLNNWDVSQVTNMSFMFSNNDFASFDQPLNNWDVSNVTNMSFMFAGQPFDQPLDNWDVSNVTNLFGMFNVALNFNQDLSAWNFNQNVVFGTFLSNTNLSTLNYELLLQSFDNQGLVDKNFEAVGLDYCDETLRDNLINSKNWTITDDVLGQCGATFNPSTTPFVTTWTVQQGDLDIEIFTIKAFDYDFTVDWGDGQTAQNVNADITHTYSVPGTYSVSITGVFPYFKTCKVAGGTISVLDCDNSTKLTSVESWGDQEWRYMIGSFSRAENFVLNTNQPPDLNFVTSLRSTFVNAESFNQNINNWDISNITDMSFMFFDAKSFDQPLNNWDVSNVTNMRGLFFGDIFNQPLDNWNVSNVTDMSGMFINNLVFNQTLDMWDVSNVTNMVNMFLSAGAFNQPLDNWDVSNVTNMTGMFNNATSFNQDLSDWCVEQIPTLPNNFATNSALQASFFPDWGATCTLSIAEDSLDNFKVYPNPVKNQLHLSWSSVNFPDEMNIQIYNLSGKKIFEQSYDQKPSEIDVSPFSSGVYLLNVISGDQSTVRRIIKK